MANLIEVKLAWNREERSIWVNPDFIVGLENIHDRYTLYLSHAVGKREQSYSYEHPIAAHEWERLKDLLGDAVPSEDNRAVPANTNCRCWSAPEPHHAMLNNMAHHLSELSEKDRNEVIAMARNRALDSDPVKKLAEEVSKLNGYALGAFMQHLMSFGETNQRKSDDD